MSENSLVTAARYSFPHEAEIAQSRLKSEGIPAFVADSHTTNMGLYSSAMAGVRLQVHKKNLVAAEKILNTDYSSFLESEVGCDEQSTCSECGARLELYTKGKRPAVVVFLLLGFPLLFYKRGLRCSHFGHITKI